MTDQIIPPAKLAHFVIRTPRFEESISWWRTVLGADVRHRNDFLCFLTYDDEHHRLAILSVPTLTGNDRGAAPFGGAPVPQIPARGRLEKRRSDSFGRASAHRAGAAESDERERCRGAAGARP